MFAARSDLQLGRDGSGRFLPWVIAVMVFLAGLAVGGAVLVDRTLSGWTEAVSGVLTAQVADAGEETEARVAEAVTLLAAAPGVASARPLGAEEIERLLEPWLGTGNLAAELPLPRLIEVELADNADSDPAGLAARLAAAVPGSRLEDPRPWLEPLVLLSRGLQGLAAGIVALVGAATAAIVVFATRAGLAAHREVIEVLHLIGARDSYIARQFQRHILRLAAAGALSGGLLAAAALASLGALGGSLRAPLLPNLELTVAGWAALALVPLAAILLAAATARLTVTRSLRRML